MSRSSGSFVVRLWCAAFVIVFARIALEVLNDPDACGDDLLDLRLAGTVLAFSLFFATLIVPAAMLLHRLRWDTFIGYGMVGFVPTIGIALYLFLPYEPLTYHPEYGYLTHPPPPLSYLLFNSFSAALTTAAFAGALCWIVHALRLEPPPQSVSRHRAIRLVGRTARIFFWVLVVLALARDISMVGENFAGSTSLDRLYIRWVDGLEPIRCVRVPKPGE